jgi:hypothetical protein
MADQDTKQPRDTEEPVQVLATTDRCVTLRRENGDIQHSPILQPGQALPPSARELNDVRYDAVRGCHVLRNVYRRPGPARSSTPRYRDNYDAIFGKPSRGQA